MQKCRHFVNVSCGVLVLIVTGVQNLLTKEQGRVKTGRVIKDSTKTKVGFIRNNDVFVQQIVLFN